MCDVQDFVVADTKTIDTRDGPVQMHFATLGDPCSRPEALTEPFVQPFDGRSTTLARDAPNVVCEGGKLRGALYSDRNLVMIGPLFHAQPLDAPLVARADNDAPRPGRMTTLADGSGFQDEYEYGPMCAQRERNGHDSGMGEIFRRVANVAPIKVLPQRI